MGSLGFWRIEKARPFGLMDAKIVTVTVYTWMDQL